MLNETQGSKPGLLHCKRILYQLTHQRSPGILEWEACLFSRGSSRPRNRTGVSCTAGGFFTNWALREAPVTGIQFACSWGVGMPKHLSFPWWVWGYSCDSFLAHWGVSFDEVLLLSVKLPCRTAPKWAGRDVAALVGQDIAGLPFLISGNTSKQITWTHLHVRVFL